MADETKNTYEIKLRFLEKEILAFGVSSSSDSSGWINKATVIAFAVMIFIGTFGKNIVELYKSIFG